MPRDESHESNVVRRAGAATRPTAPSRRTILLPDLDRVEIPGGEFLYGEK